MYNRNLPDFVKKYFWGDNIDQLNWQDHRNYIIQTILDYGDEKASRWLLSIENKKTLFTLLPQLSLSPKSKNFWRIYLS